MNSSRMELRLHASGNTAWGYFNTQKREVNIMSSERIVTGKPPVPTLNP